MDESLDQLTNKKRDMTAGRGSATDEKEELLWKISHEFFSGFIRWYVILITVYLFIKWPKIFKNVFLRSMQHYLYTYKAIYYSHR